MERLHDGPLGEMEVVFGFRAFLSDWVRYNFLAKRSIEYITQLGETTQLERCQLPRLRSEKLCRGKQVAVCRLG